MLIEQLISLRKMSTENLDISLRSSHGRLVSNTVDDYFE